MKKLFTPLPRLFLPLCCFVLASASLAAKPPGDEPPLGPLVGKNLYTPHIPWYSFPASRAGANPVGSLRLKTALYYLNEFVSYPFSYGQEESEGNIRSDGRLTAEKQEYYTAMDYESLVWEIGMDWQLSPSWRIAWDWRLYTYFGGFLDLFIEEWHRFLNVPNAGREYYDRNRSQINIQTTREISIKTQGHYAAGGDLDLSAQWTIVDHPFWAFAATGAFKLPTGSLQYGISSGWPDLALMLQVEINPWKRWSFYLQGGVILPLEAVFDLDETSPRPMLQIIPAVEFRITEGLSALIQFNIQTSPVSGDPQGDPPALVYHPDYGVTTLFTHPQGDIKVGLKGRSRRWGWQVYVEEDPFSWEGPDLMLNVQVSYSFSAPLPSPRDS